jgi:protein-arginine kinase activator protein McsA
LRRRYKRGMDLKEEKKILKKNAEKLEHATASQIEQYIKANKIEHFDVIGVLRFIKLYTKHKFPVRPTRGESHLSKCPMCGTEFRTTKPGNRHYCASCRAKVKRMGAGISYC